MTAYTSLPAGRPVGLTASFVAAATQGTILAGAADAPLGGVSIDSRTLRPGDLFIALAGERFDGHRFTAQALAAGAAGVLVHERTAVPADARVPAILAADTTAALQDLGRAVRRAAAPVVVAITGSAGKTTTKEILADLLALRYDVFRSQGNFNNHIGLPLSLTGLRRGCQVAVVELGMNHAGELRTLTAIAEPEVRVWTNVAEVHAEFFPSIDAIADAKAEILDGATAGTLVVANAADARVMARVRACPARVVTFGIGVDADVTVRDVRGGGVTGTAAILVARGHEAALTVPLIGLGHLANVLAAAAVALEFGIPLEAIATRVAALAAAPRRGELKRLRDGILLVDDSYNSNPQALARMLEALAATPARGHRVAVLGEMLELGVTGPALHRACGRFAAAAGLGRLVAIGGEGAAALAAGAREGGMPPGSVTRVATSQEAADLMAAAVAAGDVVLVKGSRGIRTDIVADRLAAELAG